MTTQGTWSVGGVWRCSSEVVARHGRVGRGGAGVADVEDPRADHLAWHALLRRAGVSRVRLHDARHTAATLMLTMGVPARVAMDVLGHSQISLTLGTYSHVMPLLSRDAADRVGQALWGTTGHHAGTTGPPPQAPKSHRRR